MSAKPPPIDPTDLDRRIWDEELADFLPQTLFDAHIHCQNIDCCLSKPGDDPPEYKTMANCPLPVIDRAALDRIYGLLMPDRKTHFLMFGRPFRRNDFDRHNAFTAAQTVGDPHSACLMLVHPSFSPDKVAADIDRYGFVGLKPYRWYAPDEVNCRITDMLPEAIIELAHDRKLIVMMHLGRKEGVADEQNIADLLSLAERYPDVRWDLAHMARSSIAWPLERAIDRIRDVPNFWYDFSSVMHADVFMIAFRKLRLDRIMFGSDIPCDLSRGAMISFGYGWEQIWDHQLAEMNITHCDPRPTYSVYETLRAARRAANLESFGREQIEDLFFRNAYRFVHRTDAPTCLDEPADEAVVNCDPQVERQ